MQVTPAVPFSNASIPIDGVQQSSQQAGHLSSELESLFISTLLKEMRSSMGGESFFPGDDSDTLGGLFDMYMSKFIAEQGGIGLSDSLQSALK